MFSRWQPNSETKEHQSPQCKPSSQHLPFLRPSFSLGCTSILLVCFFVFFIPFLLNMMYLNEKRKSKYMTLGRNSWCTRWLTRWVRSRGSPPPSLHARPWPRAAPSCGRNLNCSLGGFFQELLVDLSHYWVSSTVGSFDSQDVLLNIIFNLLVKVTEESISTSNIGNIILQVTLTSIVPDL